MAKNKKPMMPKQITERIFEIWAKFIQYILVTVPVTSLLCLDFVQVFGYYWFCFLNQMLTFW